MKRRKLTGAKREKAQRVHDRDCPAMRDIETNCPSGLCRVPLIEEKERAMPFCKQCGEWELMADGIHRCPPAWDIWEPSSGEDRTAARTAYGQTAEEAAKDWAEFEDRQESYSIVGGAPAIFCLSQPGSDEVVVVLVRGESVPHYTASRFSSEDAAAVDEWNKKYPEGVQVEYTLRVWDGKKLEDERVGGRATKAYLDEYGPRLQIQNASPVKLKDAKVIDEKEFAR